MTRTPRPWLTLAALTLSLGAAHAQGADEAAAPPDPSATAAAEAEAGALDRWAGSRVNFINQANLWELDRGASQTWNPYYAVGFGLAPRFRVFEQLSLAASLSVAREVTRSDVTTRDGEWWLGDLTLSASAAGISLPVTGTRVSGALSIALPTSKPSQSASMLMGLRPSVSVSHRFPVLSGMTLSYSGALRYTAHRYTTRQLDDPRLYICEGEECANLASTTTFLATPPSTECAGSLCNTGVRNARWQHSHRLGLGLGVLDWLSIGGGIGFAVSHLYDGIDVVEAPDAAYTVQNARYVSTFDAEATIGPFDGFSVGIGLNTVAPQRAPDQSLHNPIYNRYTQAYVDLRLDIAGLFTSEEG